MTIRNGEIINGRKFKVLTANIYFKDESTLAKFICLYQDLFVKDWLWKDGYKYMIIETEPVYKFRLMINIWNDDWRYIKENLGFKRAIVQFDEYRKKNVCCFR